MQRNTVQLLSIGLFLGLLVWGFWTLFIYLGAPSHLPVLLDKEAIASLNGLCSPGSLFCNGLYSLFPFIAHTFARLGVFVWYGAICAMLYALAVAWNRVRTGSKELQWTMTPWKVVLLFTGMVWLIFTCLIFAKNGAVPFHTIVEPKAEVYQGVGAEALAALNKNYLELKDRGCLTRIGLFGNVAEASDISMLCFQGTFFTRVLPPLLFALILVFEILVLGRFMLRKLMGIPVDGGVRELMISLGMGVSGWIIVLWVGAVAHVYTGIFGWLLFLIVPLAFFRDAKYWLDKFFFGSWDVVVPWRSVMLLVTWFLLSYLALNYINVVRPFPIGWDDLGSYLNRPRLLVSYGKFVHSMQSFQWEYLTSLGFLLFGFESIFGATVALVINWLQGVLAILAIYTFGRMFMGPGRGILAATLYYTLPLVGHFSFADMKIDNAVFTMSALAMLCLFEALFHLREDVKLQRKWILLGGLFVGIAFGMKATAIMVFMAMGALLMGVILHWIAYPAAILFSGIVFAQQGLINIPKLADRIGFRPDAITPTMLMALFGVAGLAVFGVAAWRNKNAVRNALLGGLILLGGFAITVFPWVEHNNILHGNIIPRAELKAPNSIGPIIDQYGIRSDETPYSLSPDLATDPSHANCKSTAGSEELDRYWGNHKGWGHYLTLPWRSVMNVDHAGYYVTTQPALLLFPLLLLLPFFWKKEGSWLRWLWVSTLFLLAQWVFFANGIPWYGIGTFFGLVLCLEALIARAPDALSRSAAGFFLTMSILLCLGMRFWQFESQRNLFEYPLGKISAETMRERTIPHYDDITDIVMRRNATMADRPLVYRIGTFMPYFVPRNLEVIGNADHQLDMFNCLYQERDPAITVQRLKALGFNSIIFDTNTATIEKDPNGSLHKKVQALTDFLNSPEAGLDVVIYDPGAGLAFLLIP